MSRAQDAGAPDHLAPPKTLSAAGPAIPRHATIFSGRADPTLRLDSQTVINRAGGLLMTRHNMTKRDAFRWLLKTAMNRRVSVLTIARAVLQGMPSRGRSATTNI